MCLIASLLFFPSLPARLPASVPHPRSLTHRQRGRARETHTHSHAHAGYMNGRREPILRGRASRGARALQAGPHHGAGGRHAGDARPPGALRRLSARPSLCVLPDGFLSPLSLLSLLSFLHLCSLLLLFLSGILLVVSVQYLPRSALLPSSLPQSLSQTFSFLVPTFPYFLSSCLLFSFLPLWPYPLCLCGVVWSARPPPLRRSSGLAGAIGFPPRLPPDVISHPQHFSRDSPSRIAAAAQPEVIKS